MVTEKKFAGGTDPLVEDQGDGSHIPIVKVRGLAANGALDVTLQATNLSLGTDGANPPSIAGAGVRGWLRGIFEKLTSGFTASRAEAVTIGTAFTSKCDALRVGTAGDVVLTMGAVDITFKNVQAGETLAVKTTVVKSSGTTAGDIVALYY